MHQRRHREGSSAEGPKSRRDTPGAPNRFSTPGGFAVSEKAVRANNCQLLEGGRLC